MKNMTPLLGNFPESFLNFLYDEGSLNLKFHSMSDCYYKEKGKCVIHRWR